MQKQIFLLTPLAGFRLSKCALFLSFLCASCLKTNVETRGGALIEQSQSSSSQSNSSLPTSTTPGTASPIACTGSAARSCTVANGTGSQTGTCNTTTGVYGNYTNCAATACSSGYQLTNNACVANVETPPAQAGSCRTITQYEITWTFDQNYPCGKFVNGDWWVTPKSGGNGRVKIEGISPDVSTINAITTNGWAVNPSVGWVQSYDTRAAPDYFTAPAGLPYEASPNQSIIKAKSLDISPPNSSQIVKTVSILTILATVPDNNGAKIFRPPYVSGPKPLISVPTTSSLSALLPSGNAIGSLTDLPSLSGIKERFSKPLLVYVQGSAGSNIEPADFVPSYGPQKTREINSAILRLLLNDSLTEEKIAALASVLQQGIDQFYVFKNNGNKTLYSQGGTQPFYRALLAFTATLLGDAAMKSDLLSANDSNGDFMEDFTVYSGVGGRALFGSPNGFDGQYWYMYITDSQSKGSRDPFGYIDGGPGGGPYFNIVEPGLKSAALIAILMPSISGAWNNKELNEVIAFEKRYNSQGLHYLPDPCAPFDGAWNDKNGDGYAHLESLGDVRNELPTYSINYGPSSSGTCIPGNGRQISNHGVTVPPSGAYGSDLVNQMWNKFVP